MPTQLIIVIFLQQFVEGGAMRACRAELELKPKAARILLSFEKPNSPARPFSSASSVARLTPAWRDNSVWFYLELLTLGGDL